MKVLRLINSFGIGVGMALMCLTSCSSDSNEPINPAPVSENGVKAPPTLTPDMKKAIDAQYAVGARLFPLIVENSGEANVMFSPYSYYTAMSMLANGATGEVADELKELLGYSDIGFLNSTASVLAHSVTALDKDVTVDLANGIWTDLSLTLTDGFLSALKTFYNAEQHEVNYGDPAATGIINEWVSQKTHGKISEFYDELQIGPMNLINAMYFKGPWTTPFNPENVFEGSFLTPAGNKTVRYMSAMDMSAYYSSTDKGTTLTLPFGSGKYRLTVILPPEHAILEDYASLYDGEALSELATPGTPVEINVALPIFSLETRTKFRGIMTELGFGKLFTCDRWPGITKEDRYMKLNNVLQVATFAVDEAGGEGSAATGSEMCGDSGPGGSEEILKFVVDRPFLFLVTECGCNTPLFMGLVQEP